LFLCCAVAILFDNRFVSAHLLSSRVAFNYYLFNSTTFCTQRVSSWI